MDAPNPSSAPTFASRTPLHIGGLALNVRDLERMTGYYRDMLGLEVIARDATGSELGAGGVPFLELKHRPDMKADDAREAGLYHTAFLMPTRADLARWILHAARTRVPITGASDHTVSEAFYLDDPEGNGVEVYADRSPDGWVWTDDLVKITTDPLDIAGIVREVDPPTASYEGAPGGLRIGHVHLRVGDVPQAERFYRDGIGLAVTRGGRQGASFMSSGRYHHHLAGNVWHSRGAGMRDPDRAGLAWFSFAANDAADIAAMRDRLRAAGAPITDMTDGFETADPWGTRVRVMKT
jgi:catechol 2,3-dioxygenase